MTVSDCVARITWVGVFGLLSGVWCAMRGALDNDVPVRDARGVSRRDEQRIAAALTAATPPVALPEGATVDQLCEVAATSLAERAETAVAARQAATRGGHAIAGLIDEGWTYRRIHAHTGVSKATAGRWLAIYHEHTEGEQ